MNKSTKEEKYDNKTAKYVFKKASNEKPSSIANSPDQISKKEDSKVVAGKIENADYYF